MTTCADLKQTMVARSVQLAKLEKSGKGHSLAHQDILDELAQLEQEYRQRGCEPPPPPRLGRISTTVLGPPVSINAGDQGGLQIEIQATNDGVVATSVEYTIDPPIADIARAGSWTVAIPPGTTTQHATLTVAVLEHATPGVRTILIHESVIFGPVKDGAHQQYDYLTPDPSITIEVDPAYAAIEAKAAALGQGFTGVSVEPTQRLTWGAPTDGKAYRRRYANCTIYYSAALGAHEIHGPIRDKYDQLPKPTLVGVPSLLGIPVTDERGCPDGQGLYNHFSNQASIYWHPNTGPFAVYGAVRTAWAGTGWEAGPLGYPTRDQYMPGPNETAYRIFCVFQNGVRWQDGVTAQLPTTVHRSAGDIRDQIWQKFNDMLPAQVVRIDVVGLATVVGHPGLYPQTSTDNVSGNAYGFWEARNRAITVTLHGFVSLNWGLPDPTFDAHLSLLLFEDNQNHPAAGGPPNNMVGQGDHYVYVALLGVRVEASGLHSQTVADKVRDAITNTLGSPLQIQSTTVQPPDLFGLIVTQDGGIDVHFR